MMKLTFEKVLEYLESDRDDPAFEQWLADDPDGPRLRKEAEVFLELLRERASDEPDNGGAVAHESAEPVFAMNLESAQPLGDLEEIDDLRDIERRVNPKTVMRISNLAARAAGAVRDLGVLEISPAGPYLEPVFHPDLAMYGTRRDFGKFPPIAASKLEDSAAPRASREKLDANLMSYLAGGPGGGERRIRGRHIEIRLPDRIDRAGPLRLEIRDSRLNVPARGLELVFMPGEGPYVRLVTNSKGIVELPIPEVPGVLRIETSPPQMVRIESEDS